VLLFLFSLLLLFYQQKIIIRTHGDFGLGLAWIFEHVIRCVLYGVFFGGVTIVIAAFLKHLLVLQQQKKCSLRQSFMFGAQTKVIVLWALIDCAWQWVIEFFAPVSRILYWGLDSAVMIAMAYVLLILVDSEQGIWFAIRRSLGFVQRSWLLLIYIGCIILGCAGIVMSAGIGLIQCIFLVEKLTFVGIENVRIVLAAFIGSCAIVLLQGAIFMVYQALLNQERLEIMSQIPPYDF
jgi:hypothetical protein